MGYKLVYDALDNLLDRVNHEQLFNEKDNLLFDAAAENIGDLKCLLGVCDHSTPGVEEMRETLNLCEQLDPYFDEAFEEGEDLD